DDELIDEALTSNNPWLEGIDRGKLENGAVRLKFAEQSGSGKDAKPFLPFANGNFRTPSGKALLYNKTLAEQGLDPVTEFVPPSESRHSDTRVLPLELLSRKPDNFLNTTFTNVPALQEMEEPGLLEICTSDAQARGIADGDRVRVFNRRGEI